VRSGSSTLIGYRRNAAIPQLLSPWQQQNYSSEIYRA